MKIACLLVNIIFNALKILCFDCC